MESSIYIPEDVPCSVATELLIFCGASLYVYVRKSVCVFAVGVHTHAWMHVTEEHERIIYIFKLHPSQAG